MPVKLKTGGQNGLELKAPIKQLGGGAVDSVNGMTGDVVLDIPSKTSQLENDAGYALKSEITTYAVQYTAQTLTEDEKKQARENIGAWEAYNGAVPVVCEYDKFFPVGAKATKTLYVTNGKLTPPGSGASTDVLDAWRYVMNVTFATGSFAPSYVQKTVSSIGALANAGVFGTDFLATTGNRFEASTDPINPLVTVSVVVSNSASKKITVSANYNSGEISYSMYYTIPTATFDTDVSFYVSLKSRAVDSSASATELPQQTMAAAPAEDMQIATKKYVDSGLADKAPVGDYVTNSTLNAKGYLTLDTLPKYTGGVE